MNRRQAARLQIIIQFWEIVCDFLNLGYYVAALFVPSLITSNGQRTQRAKLLEWAVEMRRAAYQKTVQKLRQSDHEYFNN